MEAVQKTASTLTIEQKMKSDFIMWIKQHLKNVLFTFEQKVIRDKIELKSLILAQDERWRHA